MFAYLLQRERLDHGVVEDDLSGLEITIPRV
jgi:hypothetical protein